VRRFFVDHINKQSYSLFWMKLIQLLVGRAKRKQAFENLLVRAQADELIAFGRYLEVLQHNCALVAPSKKAFRHLGAYNLGRLYAHLGHISSTRYTQKHGKRLDIFTEARLRNAELASVAAWVRSSLWHQDEFLAGYRTEDEKIGPHEGTPHTTPLGEFMSAQELIATLRRFA
jgi:hypothetical protein